VKTALFIQITIPHPSQLGVAQTESRKPITIIHGAKEGRFGIPVRTVHVGWLLLFSLRLPSSALLLLLNNHLQAFAAEKGNRRN